MSKPSILLVHCFYQQAGGEDEVFRREKKLLEDKGHQVQAYTLSNEVLSEMSSVQAAKNTIWNANVQTELAKLLEKVKPEIVHFHNTFPLMSPAVYYAAKKSGAAVIKTLHNYRLLCANALFFRDHHPCEDCLGKKVQWPGIVHRCYRGSVAGSAVVVGMSSIHSALGTWSQQIDRFIVLSEFAKNKFTEGGIRPEKLVIKPNFAFDTEQLAPKLPNTLGDESPYALFVGRLSEEKGILTLLKAWKEGSKAAGMTGPSLKLKIVGDGPLKSEVEKAALNSNLISYLGSQPKERVYFLMNEADFLVIPSVCYEGLPMVVPEAFSLGLPILASQHGGLSALIEDGKTGWFFKPGDSSSLAKKAGALTSQSAQNLRANCRAEYERLYSSEKNYEKLNQIYVDALRQTQSHS